jgi:hydrophobic/amphiphilic exporter-1 (mainly G- bacteria), HAE1 family
MNLWLEKIIRRPVAVGVTYGVLLLGCVVAFMSLPMEVGPTADLPVLEISTSWERVSSETVEQTITAPLEEMAGMLNGVRRIYSVSEEGHSRVSIEFEPETDLDLARLTLREHLAGFSLTLPDGVSTPSIQSSVPGERRDLRGFLSYSLAGGWGTSSLRQYAKEVIVPRLESVEGVRNVEVSGGADREVQVALFPDRMAAFGVNPDKVTGALIEARPDISTSVLQGGGMKAIVLMQSNRSSIRDLRRMVVSVTPGGAPVRLCDIAAVEEGLAASTGIYRMNGQPSVVVHLDKESDVSIVRVEEAVERAIQEVRSRLPKGMEIIRGSDKSDSLREELRALSTGGMFSILWIMISLQLFLRDLRASLVVLSSMVLSMSAAFLLFRLLSVSLHLFTLGGLVLGFTRVVDTTIALIDSIQFHSVQRRSDRILHAMAEVARPLIMSTVTAIGVLVLASILLRGAEPVLPEFALAFGIPLVSSLVVSLTFTPTIAGVMPMKGCAPTSPGHYMSTVMCMYQRLLRRLMRKRWWVIGLSVWALGMPLWLMPDHLEADNVLAVLYNRILDSRLTELLREYLQPVLGGSSYLFATRASSGERWDSGGETYLLVRITLPQGSEPDLYERIATRLEHAVMSYRKHLNNIATLVSREGAFVQINLTDSASATAIPLEIREVLVRSAERIGGVEIGVYGFGSGFAGHPAAVPSFLVEVRGYAYIKVKEVAEGFRKAVQRNPRITDVDIDGTAGGRRYLEVAALIDREALSRFGVRINEVVEALGQYAGATVAEGEVRLNGKILPLSATYAGHHDFAVHDLASAVVTTGSGRTFRLPSLITLRERPMTGRIIRENQEYIRWVRCGYKGPYREGEEFLHLTMAGMYLPPGYSIRTVLPGAVMPVTNVASTWWCVLATAAFVIMAATSFFESYAKGFVVLFSTPISFTGPFLIFGLSSLPFNSGGYAVMLLLIVIVTTNAILFIDCIARRVKNEDHTLASIIRGSSRRFRAIVTATTVTMGGITPFLWIMHRSNAWYSTAWGLAGGLLVSTVVSLIIVPVVYLAVSGLVEGVEAHGISRRT